MAKSVKIYDNQCIVDYLVKQGFKVKYNEYCPSSIFYSKVLDVNIIVFVRIDFMKTKTSKTYYEFECWKRDKRKSVIPQWEQDSDFKTLKNINNIDSFIDYIDKLIK